MSCVLALLTLHTTSAALLPQSRQPQGLTLRGSHRVSRTGGVGASDFEETRDSEESIIPLQRADGSLVDDLRQDFRAKLSEMFEREEMQREDERASPPSRGAARSAAGAPLDSDYAWQVARPLYINEPTN